MQTDTTPYPQPDINSQLATHRLVELKLTTRKLPELQLATRKFLGSRFTDMQLADCILESLTYLKYHLDILLVLL